MKDRTLLDPLAALKADQRDIQRLKAVTLNRMHSNSERLTVLEGFGAYKRAVRATSVQSIPHNTLTVVIYNSLVDDFDPNGDITYSTSTGIATINNAGIYIVTAGLAYDNAASNYTRQLIRILKTGTQIAGNEATRHTSVSGINLGVSTIIECDAADTIAADTIQSNVGTTAQNIAISSSCHISIARYH